MLHFKNANQSIPISPVRDIGEANLWGTLPLSPRLVDAVELVRQ